jgi:hypothetical protein
VHYLSRDALGLDPETAAPISPEADRRVLEALARTRYDWAFVMRRFVRQSTFAAMHFVRANTRISCWQYPTNLSMALARRAGEGWRNHAGDTMQLAEPQYYQSVLAGITGERLPWKPVLAFPATGHQGSERGMSVGLGIDGRGWQDGEAWVRVAQALSVRGFDVELFGGPSARRLADKIVSGCPQVISHVDAMTLARSFERFGRLDYYLGNDTGLTHLAAYAGLPTVVVLGGGGISRFFPWKGASNQFVIHRSMGCCDCAWECPYHRRLCHAHLPVREVLDYFLEVVNGPRPEPVRDLAPEPSVVGLNWPRANTVVTVEAGEAFDSAREGRPAVASPQPRSEPPPERPRHRLLPFRRLVRLSRRMAMRLRARSPRPAPTGAARQEASK